MPFPYQLKIKIKALAAEARIIRRAEKQAKKEGQTSRLTSLHLHRVHTVRRASREAQLAYGYLRGRTYAQIEGTSKTSLAWRDVDKMVMKYGTKEQWLALPDWLPERDAVAATFLKKERDKAA